LKKRDLRHQLFSPSFLLSILVLLQICAFAPSFAADQIVYDMSAVNVGGASISNQNYLAQSFTTDSATVTLASVHVRIRNDVGNGLHYSVALYSSNSGSPGSKIADLATNVSMNRWEEFNNSYTSQEILSANTKYFIVVYGTDNSGPVWKFNSQLPSSSISPAPTFSSFQSSNHGTTWSQTQTPNKYFNMGVTVAPYVAPILAPAFTLSSTSESATVGQAITGYSINSTGGAIDSFSITPSQLPSGIIFSSMTGLLSGAPNSAQQATIYTITAHNVTAPDATAE